MSGFEILFLGLIMMCTDPGQCAVNGQGLGDPAARALLVNGMETGPICENGRCEVCGGGSSEMLHQPLVVFRTADVEVTGLSPDDLSCQPFAEGGVTVPAALGCWEPRGRLCVEVTESTGSDLRHRAGSATTTGPLFPRTPTDEEAFQWVVPVSAFDSAYTKLKNATELGPEADKLVIASLDLPDRGELSATLLGRGCNRETMGYAAWRSAPADRGRALAEGIRWSVNGQTLTLGTCPGVTPSVRLQFASPANVAIVNAPQPIFDAPGGGATGATDLGHFKLYYELFASGDGQQCKYPRFAGGVEALLKPFNFSSYLAARTVPRVNCSRGSNPEEVSVLAFQDLPIRPYALDCDASLCPPSKFP